MAEKSYNAGVKEYRETYWMPEYTPKETDILACFKVTPQPGVPREEVAAASDQPVWTAGCCSRARHRHPCHRRDGAAADIPDTGRSALR